ncbi:hypothetical protein ANN_08500 [Periplaneta americana]|uniref:Uncharacterized protein n=1 Tax=Periplaneta americana TaxID=6978 RepID=A0ABQ8T2R8_PERAM|nr:hypothetical protein ANN_08500 [Periplaneta americana]
METPAICFLLSLSGKFDQDSGRQHSLKWVKGKRSNVICPVVQQEEVESIPASSHGCTVAQCADDRCSRITADSSDTKSRDIRVTVRDNSTLVQRIYLASEQRKLGNATRAVHTRAATCITAKEEHLWLSRLRHLPAGLKLRSGAGSIPAWADYLVGVFPRFSPTVSATALEGPRPTSRLLASSSHAEAEVNDHPTRMEISCG